MVVTRNYFQGLPSAHRAVIHKPSAEEGYRLLVDGTDLRAVLGLRGMGSNGVAANNSHRADDVPVGSR